VYESLLEQARTAHDLPDAKMAFDISKRIQKEWKAAGKVPAERRQPIWDEFSKLNNRIFSRYKRTLNPGPEMHPREVLRKIEGMVEELKKLEEGSIDLVICRHTLEHLATEYSVNVVREIHRVAKWAIITSIDAVNTQLRPNGITARSVNLEKNEYYTILGDPFKRYWDSMGEPPTENSFNMNLYCFKN
jgi:hypothetical protein